jgi:membrane-bound metal-dependent hydrolase YbcI (DUF457 family)
MPSPIAHAAMGYLIYRVSRRMIASTPPHNDGNAAPIPDERSVPVITCRLAGIPVLLLATVGFSLLPDLDSIPGFILDDLGRFHNNFMHSFFFGAIIALLAGTGIHLYQRQGFWHWFLIALACYEMHIIMDYFTGGRGVMLLWPFSMERYSSPVALFYGLHWSEGLISTSHIWTVLSEAIFALAIIILPGRWLDTLLAISRRYIR